MLRYLPLVLLLALTAPLAAQPLSDPARADTLDLSVWTRTDPSGLGFSGLPLRSVREVAALSPGVYRDFGTGTLFYRASASTPSPRTGGVFDRERVGQGPTFVVDGVVHYCVANMPGAAPRTSSEALNNATLPFGLALADQGLEALRKDPHLARGLNVLKGEITYPAVAQAMDRDFTDPFGVWAGR